MPKEGTDQVTRQAGRRVQSRVGDSRAPEEQVVRHSAKQKTVASSSPQAKKKKNKTEPEPLSEYEQMFLSCVVPGHVVSDLDTPEFDAACTRMEQAWDGTLPEGTEPPVYASHYSYLPEQYRIPQGTVIPPGAPATSNGCTKRNILWSEETTDLALLAEFGSVELGRKWLRHVTENADTIGGTPRPDDPSIRTIPIPGRTYHIRLWTGGMDQSRLVCWNFMDNKTGKPRLRPSNLKIYALFEGERTRLASLEEGCNFDLKKSKWPEGATETFCAEDGTVVDFIIGKTTLLRLQLPSRPFAGPPRIKKYREHKILPIEDDEDDEEESEKLRDDEEEKD
ncbi:hypothetical protein EV122DRAFT_272581 [Schizophyllum commune]